MLKRWQVLKYLNYQIADSAVESHVHLFMFQENIEELFNFLLSQMLKSQTQSAEISLVLVAIQKREDTEKTWAQEDLKRSTYSLPLWAE